MAAVGRIRIAPLGARTLIAAVLLMTAVLLPVQAADPVRPLLILYETTKGEGADKELAESTTRAIRNYLREVQKVDVAIFNRDSPTVARAIMEKKLTAERVASYASQEERLEVAGVLGFQYAAGAEVSIREIEVEAKPSGAVSTRSAEGPEQTKPAEGAAEPPAPRQRMSLLEVKLWIGRPGGGKADRWEAIGTASAVGAGARDLDNAMQSSASFAVNDIARRAFANLPRIPDKSPENGSESTAISADQPVGVSVPTAGDYAARAEESLKSGNLALAIRQFSQAVNADPLNGALRVKLAEAYVARGMYAEAEDELKRAENVGAGVDLISSVRQRLEAARNGQAQAQTPPTNEEPVGEKPAPREDRPINGAYTAAVAKMVEGDKLLSQGKSDEAAAAYAEAAKLDPSDWRAYERLAVVKSSMSLFGEARKFLELLAKAQPRPSRQIIENRYGMLRRSFDKHFLSLLKQYENDGADFERHIITRESYYNAVKGLSVRLEAMASFLDAMTVPASKQPAHLRRSVACGLAAQAASSLLDYLETNNEKSKANASVFASQAKSEMEAAAKLEENKVIVAE